MSGQLIFGGLEKYDKIWRTGANRNTVITFDKEVEIKCRLLCHLYQAKYKKLGSLFLY